MSIAEVLTAGYLGSGQRVCWAPHLRQEFSRPYMRHLRRYLADEESRCQVFPKPEHIFEALDETSLEEVKVVIVGQDPYPEPGQAHGLAFSTLLDRRPPTLAKIFAEVRRNMNQHAAIPTDHNCLTPWARQGVLLLNRVLTVRGVEADTHQSSSGKPVHGGQGWERFTDHIVETINGCREHVVFMLWGDHAKEARLMIDAERHKVLCSQHPRSRLDCTPFSQANQYLEAHNSEPIDWLDVCKRPPPEEQDAIPPFTSSAASTDAEWDRAFADSIPQIEQLAEEAAQQRRAGQTEELDPSQL